MTYIIHGATGAQGAPVFKRLQAAGLTAVAGVRNKVKTEDTSCVQLDNASVKSLAAAYRNAEGVFIHLPQTAEENRKVFAQNIAKAVGLAKPERIVISTSGGTVVDEPDSPLHARSDSAIAMLIEAVQQTGVPTVVIAPRLFLENFLMPDVLNTIRKEGAIQYPVRADLAVSWTSHLDVADVAARLLTDKSVSGVVGVGQLPGITGADLAGAFSRHLGRPVTYESIEPAYFGKRIEPLLGPAAAAVAGLYQALAGVHNNTIAPHTSAQRLLGITPRSVQQWLQEVLGS